MVLGRGACELLLVTVANSGCSEPPHESAHLVVVCSLWATSPMTGPCVQGGCVFVVGDASYDWTLCSRWLCVRCGRRLL